MANAGGRDERRYERQGFGRRLDVGGPAGLLIVDFTAGFVDPKQLGGGNIEAAVRPTRAVLLEFRARRLPVAYSRIVFAKDGSDVNVFGMKVPTLLTLQEDSPESAIIAPLEPVAGELVVSKTVPSAFFGTDLVTWLLQRRVSALFVAGVTTSGCVRASVVDAMSHGFRPVVLEDCVGDRAIDPHDASLFDMQQKYAEVMSSVEALRVVRHQAVSETVS